MLFVGDDWAEAHHDIKVQDETGRRLVRPGSRRAWPGIATLYEIAGGHAGDGDDPAQVVVGIETDRGPVGAGAAGRRLPSIRDQPALGRALLRAAHHLGSDK